jgi:predicted ester cyclase
MPSSQCARVNLLGKQGKEISVSAKENKAIVRRWFEDLFNGGNLDVADEIVALNHVTYDPALPDVLSGSEGQKQVVSLYRDAFPDAHITVEHQIAVGNKVVTRWTARGTHQGELMSVAPTGNRVEVPGITIDRVSGGKLEETWTN